MGGKKKSKKNKTNEDVSDLCQTSNHERETVEDMAKEDDIEDSETKIKKLEDENESLKIECKSYKKRNEELEQEKKKLEEKIQLLTVMHDFDQSPLKKQENSLVGENMENKAKETSGQASEECWSEFEKKSSQRSQQNFARNEEHLKVSPNCFKNKTFFQDECSQSGTSRQYNARADKKLIYQQPNVRNISNTSSRQRTNVALGFGQESEHIKERPEGQVMKDTSWDEAATYKKQSSPEDISDYNQCVLEEGERSVNKVQNYNASENRENAKYNRNEGRFWNTRARDAYTTKHGADHRNRYHNPEHRRPKDQREPIHKTLVNKKVTEIDGDLFQAPKDNSLAHCVAADLRMGSGIAVQFKQLFKRVDELLQQRKRVGETAVLEDNGRYIYYLVTKKQSIGKPTMQSLEKALQDMKKHVICNGVKHIAIPRLGCGLDRLDWRSVSNLLEETFKDTDVNITAYNFTVEKEIIKKPSLHIVEKMMKLVDIERNTLLVFFGSVCGFEDDAMKEADKKFGFIQDYKQSKKKIGELLLFKKLGEIICILIVKEQKEEYLSYTALNECLRMLKKVFIKEMFQYLGFSAFIDHDDDLTVAKIITMLKIYFAHTFCEAWICWPQHLETVHKELTNDHMSFKIE